MPDGLLVFSAYVFHEVVISTILELSKGRMPYAGIQETVRDSGGGVQP